MSNSPLMVLTCNLTLQLWSCACVHRQWRECVPYSREDHTHWLEWVVSSECHHQPCLYPTAEGRWREVGQHWSDCLPAVLQDWREKSPPCTHCLRICENFCFIFCKNNYGKVVRAFFGIYTRRENSGNSFPGNHCCLFTVQGLQQDLASCLSSLLLVRIAGMYAKGAKSQSGNSVIEASLSPYGNDAIFDCTSAVNDDMINGWNCIVV